MACGDDLAFRLLRGLTQHLIRLALAQEVQVQVGFIEQQRPGVEVAGQSVVACSVLKCWDVEEP